MDQQQFEIPAATASDVYMRIQECNKAYYNGEPLITDEEYDSLIEVYKNLTGNTPTTATPVDNEKVRVPLPVYMGGTNKFKYNSDPRILQRFMAGCDEFLVTEKLDGTAALVEIQTHGFSVTPATPARLRAYTRGDYTTGFEITDLMHSIFQDRRSRASPLSYIVDSTVHIRGELIIPQDVFQQKYSSDFTNARSLVNGVVNAKTRDPEIVKDIKFVAFEILRETITSQQDGPAEPLWGRRNALSRITFSEQFQVLEARGIETPRHITLTANDITPEKLADVCGSFQQSSEYSLDGLVIYRNSRPEPLCTDKNPSFSIAYKPATETILVTVSEIEWTSTRYNKLKPVAVFPAVTLSNTSVTRATAHNGRYVLQQKIGPGAVIEITKSNEVIPYIVRVIEPVLTPSIPPQNHEWDSNMVDYVGVSVGADPVVLVKQITHFLKTTGVKGISEKTVQKITETGVSSILEFLMVTDETLESLPGFKTRKIEAFRNSLSVLFDGVLLPDIMAGAPEFPHGFGKRKFRAIVAQIPDIMDLINTEPEPCGTESPLVSRLASVRGISEESAVLVSNGLPLFSEFINAAVSKRLLSVVIPSVQPPVEGMDTAGVGSAGSAGSVGSVVFSGFRDAGLEAAIVQKGGDVKTCVTSKTNIVLVKNFTKDTNGEAQVSAKARRAEELGIPVMLKTEFEARFLS